MLAGEKTTYLSRMRSTYTREVGRGGWRSPKEMVHVAAVQTHV